MTEAEYKRIIEQIRIKYYQIGSIACPVLNNDTIVFNSIGFKHLRYKVEARPISEQLFRFSLLPLAGMIVGSTDVTIRLREKREIKYWSIDKHFGERVIRVVVRQIGNSQKHFLSIMERTSKNPPDRRVI